MRSRLLAALQSSAQLLQDFDYAPDELTGLEPHLAAVEDLFRLLSDPHAEVLLHLAASK